MQKEPSRVVAQSEQNLCIPHLLPAAVARWRKRRKRQ